MEIRRFTVFGVAKEAFEKTFKHFFASLQGVLAMMFFNALILVGTLIIVVLGALTWCFIKYILSQAPNVTISIQEIVLREEAIIRGMLWVYFFIALMILAWMSLGIMRYFLRLSDMGSASWRELFISLGMFTHVCMAGLLSIVLVLCGLFLFVLPGVYVALRLSQTLYFVLDRNEGAINALTMSWAATKGYCWQLFFVYIIIGVIHIVGGSSVLLTLISIPIAFIMQALVYRKLTQQLPAQTVTQ
jgi:uncharacterized membrane protein